MNYKTYAEAKIANPDSEIVTTTKLHSNGPEFEFLPVKFIEGYCRSQCDYRAPNVKEGAWVICNPADYCSSVKEFLESGFKLDEGDKFIGINAVAVSVKNSNASNTPHYLDANRYILSAAALNGGCKMPAKSEQWSIYNNTLPLCEMTDEQYGKMRRMSDSGATVKSLNEDGYGFQDCALPTWISNGVYRIKLQSEREMFIDEAISHAIKPETQSPKQIFGELFDSGKFKYIDNTQHFGENI